jgi:BarA-like signal transduction histidine kinase
MVFLTGGAFTPEAQAFLDQQGHRCLLKPFKPKELLETVATALGNAAPEARGAARPTSILAPR